MGAAWFEKGEKYWGRTVVWFEGVFLSSEGDCFVYEIQECRDESFGYRFGRELFSFLLSISTDVL